MVRLGFFEVTVSSPGIGQLPEHSDPDEQDEIANIEGSAVATYLEATAGAAYCINCTIRPDFSFEDCNAIIFDVKNGGNHLTDVVATEAEYEDGWTFELDGRDYRSAKGWKTRPLTFGRVEIAEHNVRSPQTTEAAKQLGQLTVEVWRCNVDCVTASEEEVDGGSPITLSEKLLKGKALDLATTLGAAENCKPSDTYSVDLVGEEPLATFILKYRGKQALQQLGIISRPATPEPLTQRDVDSLNTEELKERLRQAEADAQAKVIAIKQEKVEELSRKRGADCQETVRPSKKRAASEWDFMEQSFEKIKREMQAFGTDRTGTPRKLEKHKSNILRNIENLQAEVGSMVNGDEDEEVNVPDEDVTPVDGPPRGPRPGQEVLELSDDE